MVHDFVQKVDQIAVDRRDFYVSPSRWNTSRVSVSLNWMSIQFSAANQASVPRAPGVYSFVVRRENGHFPPHGFIMYVGITTRTLRKRYGEYLDEMRRGKRPRVYYMLNKYPDDLYFNYVSLQPETADLEQLELDLNDAILPPVVTKDFTAEIRDLVSALR
ncbi:hypothetical protein JYK14_03320 [Siccirubricoccus sp. KC 17139]|uniref:GIY-YIG domain-containing protein n=1 Tax=Siccirubricoccus soli TaxID=2899147 RepID=A0ABT1CZW6_9PROT|nr:hypothetical protein [Siccirubricoccus soli]MCO6415206.1 hypothetical protein [Siccirubricoccus soli]MCP2681337.1 hypothetical protein [Siccirubricoccus soli]